MLNEHVIAKYKNALLNEGFLYLGNKCLKDYYNLTFDELNELNERVGIHTMGFSLFGKGEQLNLIGKEDKNWNDAIEWLKKERFYLPLEDFEAINDYLYHIDF